MFQWFGNVDDVGTAIIYTARKKENQQTHHEVPLNWNTVGKVKEWIFVLTTLQCASYFKECPMPRK